MPVMEMEFEVYCNECGAHLCSSTTVHNGKCGPVLHIDPCEKCIKKAGDDAWQEGYDERKGEEV